MMSRQRSAGIHFERASRGELWYNSSNLISKTPPVLDAPNGVSNHERSRLSMATPDHTTIQIQLTRGYVTTVDSCDADLASLKWCALVRKNGVVYAMRGVFLTKNRRTTQSMHRIIFARVLGRDLLSTEQVDHVDLDGTNNRRENLRLASNQQNSWNQRVRSTNKSGFKGVSWEKTKGKWRASIVMNGKHVFLGYFAAPEQAHEAYCAAAEMLHGEFARLK